MGLRTEDLSKGGRLTVLLRRTIPANSLALGRKAKRMIPYKSTLMTVPPTLEKQLEVLEAIRLLATQDAEAVKGAVLKASPDDPEHPGWPAGTPGGRGGEFRPTGGARQPSADSTETVHDGSKSSAPSTASDVEAIIATARRLNLAVVSGAYQKCVDLCYPLLERFQPAGSDRNLWDFHRCLNACLGR